MKPLLSVTQLTQTFKTKRFFKKQTYFKAVDDISFDLQPGEILGLLGPNGAGKTTTIQMLLGLLTPTSGSINYFGKALATNRSEILNHVTFLSPYIKLPGSLTVEENLRIYGMLYGIPKEQLKQAIEQHLDRFNITTLRSQRAKTLSAGQLTRLMLAKAFLPNPKIVLLDEPTAALDPDIAAQVRKFIRQERQRTGLSVILTSHNMTEVEEVCDRVLVMRAGTIIASETPEKLAQTVTTSKVHLLVTDIDKAIACMQEKNYLYAVDEQFLEIRLDEQKIPDLLADIVHFGIKYTEISIEKPSLEDYFLHIAKGGN